MHVYVCVCALCVTIIIGEQYFIHSRQTVGGHERSCSEEAEGKMMDLEFNSIIFRENKSLVNCDNVGDTRIYFQADKPK